MLTHVSQVALAHKMILWCPAISRMTFLEGVWGNHSQEQTQRVCDAATAINANEESMRKQRAGHAMPLQRMVSPILFYASLALKPIHWRSVKSRAGFRVGAGGAFWLKSLLPHASPLPIPLCKYPLGRRKEKSYNKRVYGESWKRGGGHGNFRREKNPGSHGRMA